MLLTSIRCTYAQTFTISIPGNPLDTTGWNGQGKIVGDVFQLTEPTTSQVGFIYNRTPRDLTTCAQFTVNFDFRITEPSSPVADGIAFWYISNPPVGGVVGGGIGLPNNPNGFVFIMDTYKNSGGTYFMPIVSMRMMEGTYNYIENDPVGRITADLTGQFFIVDGQWHNCKIHYLYGNISVSFDNGPVVMTGYQPLAITGYFGFSGSTGSAYSRQSIRNVTITGAPNPAPDAPIVRDTAYCLNQPAAQLTATGDNLVWYDSDTATTPLPAAPIPNTSIPGTYAWYVTQGITGCSITSTRARINVVVHDSVVARFTDSIQYACGGQDTVRFFNNSYGSNLDYVWSFGDNTVSTDTNPVHAYANGGTYNVILLASDNLCHDTATATIVVRDTLHAAFGVSADSICQHTKVSFTDSSTGTGLAHAWVIGNGNIYTTANPEYTFDTPGIYRVRLVVNDIVPCYDTAYRYIVVDSMPSLNITLSDSAICVGADINFFASYLQQGLENFSWDMGDGTILNDMPVLHHAYDKPGEYTVVFKANYRVCPDTSVSKKIIMHPYPVVNIGPDTTICPGEGAIELSNQSYNDPAYTHVWSNGNTASWQMSVNAPGTYWLKVSTPGGCATADTVEVRPSCYIAIPNAFTPNGDGANDYFFPRQLLSRAVLSFHMVVYDRWGQVMFESDQLDGRGWDGTYNAALQQQGVYVYLIEVAYRNGISEKYQGNVTLLR